MSLYTADFGATGAMTGAAIERSFLAVEAGWKLAQTLPCFKEKIC